MAKKAKQRMKQSLINFGRIWNSSKASPDQKAAAAEHFSDGPGPANRHSDNSERRPRKMKGVGLLVILFVILLALLIYHRSTMKKSEGSIAKVEALDLDTISASRVSQVQEMKKQSVSVHPVQQEVTTVSEPESEQKQQAEPEQEPTKTEPEYAPNGEVLIQKPVYPKNGFDSYQEQEEYFNTLQEYWKQQRRISDWEIQHDVE